MGLILDPEGVGLFPSTPSTLDAYGNVIRWTTTPASESGPSSGDIGDMYAEVTNFSYRVNKNTHRVKFVDETENEVTVIIEPKDSPA